MPTIQLTNNTTLNIAASAADQGATLNRYLKNPLVFITPAGFESIAGTKIGDIDATAFPITANATGTGQFAVEETSLNVQLGASASLGFLTGDAKTGFLGSVDLPDDPAVAALVSFELQGTISGDATAATSEFTFGINKSASIALTSFSKAAATDTLAGAVERAIAALTIPHDIDDLRSLPAGAICQIEGSSSLQFTASVTYNILNDPLATTAVSKLPSITVNANAGGTLEATITDTSDHTVTIASLPNGLVHLAVSRTRTDDFETSLTVSAGVTANVGSLDALAFLLDKISPNSTAELAKIKADMTALQAQQLNDAVKGAINAALSNSVQISLKAALDASESKNRVFLYEIALTALDANSTTALQSALRGDFTMITRPGAVLAGIRELDSALSVTSKVTHSLALHLLGIFNWGGTSTFIEKSKIDYTKDTHEIVLSDETIDVASNSLTAEKLREIVIKGITLTLPASANTPEATNPLNLVFFDREAATSPSTMRQFGNVLKAISAPTATSANSLLDQTLKQYGTSALYLGLNLTPGQCRQLFIDSAGKPYGWTTYVQFACGAEGVILDGDGDNADRLRLFQAGLDFWKELENAGAAPNVVRLLATQGIRQNAVVDVITILWWSSAMGEYAEALSMNQPLANAGKAVVKEGTMGFNEPWLVLAAWAMLGKPAMESRFTSSLLKPAVGAAT
ncbi:MAG TPA: hypothetical protein VK335_03615 [Bryobacteraceae bacterium]|nr:hypothetical protein [Bryobacteraceae bacterium]